MIKWNEPPEPIPFWLHPELEVKSDPPKPAKGDAICASIKAFIALGCSVKQALELTANSVVETGWFRFYRAWNLGGVKIWKGTANDPDGTPRQWWRAPGNKDAGDPPWCYYRAYKSLEDYNNYWIHTFVPKDESTGSGRYAATGKAFWAGKDWFPELIKAGYKGEVTRKHPDGAIKEFKQIVTIEAKYYAQQLLNCVPDGVVGHKTEAAIEEAEKRFGLPITGEFSDALYSKLFGYEFKSYKKEESAQQAPTPAVPAAPAQTK